MFCTAAILFRPAADILRRPFLPVLPTTRVFRKSVGRRCGGDGVSLLVVRCAAYAHDDPIVGDLVVAAGKRILLSDRMSRKPIQAQSGDITDHDRAKLRSGWMSASSATLIASRYFVRASPSLTRLAEPHVNAGRPSFIAIMSAIKRACLPLPLGKG
jgi:hypothetical protein